jgi:hypothetical protein
MNDDIAIIKMFNPHNPELRDIMAEYLNNNSECCEEVWCVQNIELFADGGIHDIRYKRIRCYCQCNDDDFDICDNCHELFEHLRELFAVAQEKYATATEYDIVLNNVLVQKLLNK